MQLHIAKVGTDRIRIRNPVASYPEISQALLSRSIEAADRIGIRIDSRCFLPSNRLSSFLQVGWEGLGRVENVRVPPVGQEGTVQKGLLLELNAPLEEFQRQFLATLDKLKNSTLKKFLVKKYSLFWLKNKFPWKRNFWPNFCNSLWENVFFSTWIRFGSVWWKLIWIQIRFGKKRTRIRNTAIQGLKYRR